MPTVELSVRIDAPPEAVTAVLLDADRAPEWTTGLERFDVVEGEPGQVGSIGHAHYVESGRRYTLVDVLEEATPDGHYRSRLTGGGIEATVETTLVPIGETATRLTLRWDGRGTTLLTRLVLPFMKRRIRRRAEIDLAKLARIVAPG